MLITDTEIITGLKGSYSERCKNEKILYQQYFYFIEEGCRKHNLLHEDSFSAYTDAVMVAITNVTTNLFDGRSSIKTYLYQIFSNKCIDLFRKSATNKQQVHKTAPVAEMLEQLPDGAKTIIDKLLNNELKEKVKAQLNQIGEKCKEILLLFEEGLTDKQIAETLAYNNAAVAKTTRLRCLDKLRAKVLG